MSQFTVAIINPCTEKIKRSNALKMGTKERKSSLDILLQFDTVPKYLVFHSVKIDLP